MHTTKRKRLIYFKANCSIIRATLGQTEVHLDLSDLPVLRKMLLDLAGTADVLKNVGHEVLAVQLELNAILVLLDGDTSDVLTLHGVGELLRGDVLRHLEWNGETGKFPVEIGRAHV